MLKEITETIEAAAAPVLAPTEGEQVVLVTGQVPVQTQVAQEPKKRPGRPPKKRPELSVAEVIGVAPQPVNEDDVIEMVYCNPLVFKKLLLIDKSYDVSEIEMIFEPTGLRMRAKDHLGKSNIYKTISGRCVNYYYCKERIRICIKREYLEKILGNLDKNQYKVTFILKENYRSTLYIIVKDCQYDKDKSYEVEVIYKPNEPEHEENKDDETNYPIKFVLDSKHFKSEINQVRKMSPILTIQKTGDEPLQFTFDDAKKLNYNGRYNNPGKIRLESRIAPDDIFSTSVVIDYIKPFSNACIGDDVHIAADKRERICFTTYLDKKPDGTNACEVKVFTEIKDFRRGL